MTYFKSLLINFLTVFFVNHVIPGIEISDYTKLPHIGGEMLFAFCLGFLNSLIFPILKVFEFCPTYFKIGLISLVTSLLAYAILNFLPIGVKITTPGAFIWPVLIVWFISYLTNHLEYKQFLMKKKLEEKEDHKK